MGDAVSSGVSAVGALAGGLASNSAANTQANAANNASAQQTALANQAMAQNSQLLSPYTGAGSTAINQLSSILNGSAGGATGTGAFDITKVPGYQFGLDQGNQAIQNRAGAQGMQLSGNTLSALQNNAQGYAGNAYNSYLSQLNSVAGLGQNSAVNLAGQNSNLLTGLGNNIASNTIGAGNAQAAGTIGIGNSINNGASSIANNYTQQQLLSKLFGNGSTSSGQLNGGVIDPTAYTQNYG